MSASAHNSGSPDGRFRVALRNGGSSDRSLLVRKSEFKRSDFCLVKFCIFLLRPIGDLPITDVVQRLYQRPRRLGNGPAYGYGLARDIGSPGSISQNLILGTKLEFRPTLTMHRRSSPQTRYRQIASRGLGGILNTSNSTMRMLAR
jgi:hypothetical protein